MSEMVEKVARAILMDFMPHVDAWDIVDEESRQRCRGYARAAIKAMTEPTRPMLLGGHFIAVEDACDTQCAAMTDRRLGRAYSAMIRASLHEGEAQR